jgi:chlorobactene glucosyltransferase
LRELDVVLRSRTRLAVREPAGEMPSLSIVVPARNEERQIERCVRSLLAQRHPQFEVIVVDDRSEDETRAILDRLCAEDHRLRIVAGQELPDGWIGKPWALVQGASAARGAWLLFTDADTVHEPLAAASAQREAIDRSCDALSLLTDQEVVTFAERALLPTILFTIILGIGPTDDVNDPSKRDVAIFNGQYILIERTAYDASGGHEALRAEIAEDLELARRLKRDGRFRLLLAGANGLVRTRMYRSFGEIWRGFVKNFALGARGRMLEAMLGIALLACVAISPLGAVGLFAAHDWRLALALSVTIASTIAVAELGMRRTRFLPGSALWLPVGLGVVLAIFAVSLGSMLSGRGVEWRGRRYTGLRMTL